MMFVKWIWMATLLACPTVAAAQVAPAAPAVRSGAVYVSMGSSYAAGPGITASADSPANRCSRSRDNYAHQVALRRKLVLVDVACSGATTAHVLGPWDELPPQIDAVTPETRLVTVTIGGNDVSLVRDLIGYACARQPAPPPGAPGGQCPTINIPSEQDWRALEKGLDAIASGVRQRAPGARLMFVQYVSALPRAAACPRVPLTTKEERIVRAILDRLAKVTAKVARRSGADIIDPAAHGADHGPCSVEPWATGFPVGKGPGFVPFHPNLAGMTAIAEKIDEVLGK